MYKWVCIWIYVNMMTIGYPSANFERWIECTPYPTEERATMLCTLHFSLSLSTALRWMWIWMWWRRFDLVPPSILTFMREFPRTCDRNVLLAIYIVLYRFLFFLCVMYCTTHKYRLCRPTARVYYNCLGVVVVCVFSVAMCYLRCAAYAVISSATYCGNSSAAQQAK